MHIKSTILASTMLLAACGNYQAAESIPASPTSLTEAEPVRATAQTAEQILAAMTLERKVAQLIMPDISAITPADTEKYRFGTILNGGNSGPYGDDLAPAPEWLKLSDEHWDASLVPLASGEPVVPVLWGTDAVHGHTNVKGATMFPHNIGLGATGDPDLIRKIGQATAIEIEVTGIEWTFAPTVAVARDDRWGRTYESYSEDPARVSVLGKAMVEGLQGYRSADDYLGNGRVIATAKHFFGDGGTEQGVDQGDVNGDLDALMDIHVAPYPAAIEAGVETVMASFNSINGRKMHGNTELLTGVLRGDLGFDGLVVGDWNGHGQIKGCTNTDCPQALMAGLDVYMVPEDWKGLYETLLAQVQDGTVPMARLDEAVLRVLRLKEKSGLLAGAPRPSERANAGQWDKLGSPEHRAIAREAVAKSLVLLKNDGVLPLQSKANILVAGKAANSIAQQAGGWTLTWQGGGELTNADFPGATSIYDGLSAAAQQAGGTAVLSQDGSYADKPDVAIVVFGEQPYAEFVGDRKDLAFRDEEGLRLLRQFKSEGIRTVAVFLSGRPLWVNRELNAADAFVAAWLPGSEGAGVADVLFGQAPASGRLSFSWPADCAGAPLNSADGALFALGYGRATGDHAPLATLSEECSALTDNGQADWFISGRLASDITATADGVVLPDLRGANGGVTARGIDRNAQEDAREIIFTAGSSLVLTGPKSSSGFRITYSVDQRAGQPVALSSGGSTFDITHPMAVAEGKGWREMIITDECLPGLSNDLTIRSDGDFTIKVSSIARQDIAQGTSCSF